LDEPTVPRTIPGVTAQPTGVVGALLRGLLFCVPCGTPMMHTYTMRKSKRYRYYVCYNAQQQGWKNCETKSVPAQAINDV
jgi:hypothetical protein